MCTARRSFRSRMAATCDHALRLASNSASLGFDGQEAEPAKDKRDEKGEQRRPATAARIAAGAGGRRRHSGHRGGALNDLDRGCSWHRGGAFEGLSGSVGRRWGRSSRRGRRRRRRGRSCRRCCGRGSSRRRGSRGRSWGRIVDFSPGRRRRGSDRGRRAGASAPGRRALAAVVRSPSHVQSGHRRRRRERVGSHMHQNGRGARERRVVRPFDVVIGLDRQSDRPGMDGLIGGADRGDARCRPSECQACGRSDERGEQPERRDQRENRYVFMIPPALDGSSVRTSGGGPSRAVVVFRRRLLD